MPTPRFMDNGNGTVTDNLTGLIWLKDVDCFKSTSTGSAWSDAMSFANSLKNGKCGLNDNSVLPVTGDYRTGKRY